MELALELLWFESESAFGLKDSLFEFINEAYRVEDGNSGVAFKKTPRLLSWDDTGMGQAYAEKRVLLARFKDKDRDGEGDVEGEVVGLIVWELHADSDAIHFGPLAVAPHMQKRGIAKALIRQVAEIGVSHGKSGVEISVVNWRVDILPWYQKIGFAITCANAPFPDPDRVTRPCHMVLLRLPIPIQG